MVESYRRPERPKSPPVADVVLRTGADPAEVVLTVGGVRVDLSRCRRLTLEVAPDGLPALTLSFSPLSLRAHLAAADVREEVECAEVEPPCESVAKPPAASLPRNGPPPPCGNFLTHLPAGNCLPWLSQPDVLVPALLTPVPIEATPAADPVESSSVEPPSVVEASCDSTSCDSTSYDSTSYDSTSCVE